MYLLYENGIEKLKRREAEVACQELAKLICFLISSSKKFKKVFCMGARRENHDALAFHNGAKAFINSCLIIGMIALLMHSSCHFGRSSNFEIGVEC